ncbi:MAG: hypothetical protein IKT67_05975 [Lachnospiraceae bacterium]|nr:hypothetical protein [Lachnospiraceae bacterium]
MSAIWGMIAKDTSIPETTVSAMQNSMRNFKIDRYHNIVRGSVYFACGLQHFTKISQTEQFPLYDEATDTYFTADCVLINREDVILLLSTTYKDRELTTLSDGALSYKMYQQFGERFVEYLRGSFSFAVYCASKKELLLYADHFARRYLAYSVHNDKVCFSTAYQPLLAVLAPTERKLNRQWIASAYTDFTADTIKLHGATVYENIFHVEPGQYIKIHTDSHRVEKYTYWNPLTNLKKLNLAKDEDYCTLFLSTFRKAVTDLLCVEGEVGIMLSGGLDSSSVAAFAASVLQKRNLKLYGYTAVPCKDYKAQNTRTQIENETSFILAQQQMYPNLHPQFIGSDSKNAFSSINAHAACYMEPVKPILNMVNTHGMMEQAAADGCRLILSGQNGNATISYGGIRTYIYQKLKGFCFGDAYRAFQCFCKRHHVSKKYFIKVFFKTWQEEHLKKYKLGDDCFLKQDHIRTYNVEAQERKLLKARGNGCMDSEAQRNGFGFMPLVYQHMGFYDTMGSLRYGVLSVDPTLTKEMVELCLSLPIDCYVKNGKERRAIRDYMKGYVPDVILDNFAGRGVQAADFAFRVNRDWDSIREEVFRLLENPKLKEYLDEHKIAALIDELKQKEYKLEKSDVAKAAVIASLSAFLNQVENGE